MPKNTASPEYDELMALDRQVCFSAAETESLGSSLTQLISALER